MSQIATALLMLTMAGLACAARASLEPRFGGRELRSMGEYGGYGGYGGYGDETFGTDGAAPGSDPINLAEDGTGGSPDSPEVGQGNVGFIVGLAVACAFVAVVAGYAGFRKVRSIGAPAYAPQGSAQLSFTA